MAKKTKPKTKPARRANAKTKREAREPLVVQAKELGIKGISKLNIPNLKKAIKAAKSKATKAKNKPQSLILRKANEDPDPNKMATQVAVWDSYGRRPSIRAVVADTGFSDWIVRKIIDMDRPRLFQMWYERLEDIVATWESAAVESAHIVKRILKMYNDQLDEIEKAAKEGRATFILDDNGDRLPVQSARGMVVMSRMMAQVMQLCKESTSVTAGFRTTHAVESTPTGGGADKAPEEMSDLDLARAITAGGLKVPPILAQKAKAIMEQAETDAAG